MMNQNRMREIRAHYRISQFVLGLKAGICQTRISYFERSLIEPRVDEKAKLSKALGLSVEEVFPSVTNSKSLEVK